MKRWAYVQPGYDCIATPCGVGGCGTRPGSSHGQHCDDWVYIVAPDEGDCALALVVFSGVYPRGPRREAHGADLTLHASWTNDREQIRDGVAGEECQLLGGAPCYRVWSSALHADEFWREYGAPGGALEQPESFWRGLEQRCESLAIRARDERADTRWRQCPCCKGAGTVGVPS